MIRRRCPLKVGRRIELIKSVILILFLTVFREPFCQGVIGPIATRFYSWVVECFTFSALGCSATVHDKPFGLHTGGEVNVVPTPRRGFCAWREHTLGKVLSPCRTVVASCQSQERQNEKNPSHFPALASSTIAALAASRRPGIGPT
jgi:hypothetical protein